jgi:hypothetical protein
VGFSTAFPLSFPFFTFGFDANIFTSMFGRKSGVVVMFG